MTIFLELRFTQPPCVQSQCNGQSITAASVFARFEANARYLAVTLSISISKALQTVQTHRGKKTVGFCPLFGPAKLTLVSASELLDCATEHSFTFLLESAVLPAVPKDLTEQRPIWSVLHGQDNGVLEEC